MNDSERMPKALDPATRAACTETLAVLAPGTGLTIALMTLFGFARTGLLFRSGWGAETPLFLLSCMITHAKLPYGVVIDPPFAGCASYVLRECYRYRSQIAGVGADGRVAGSTA